MDSTHVALVCSFRHLNIEVNCPYYPVRISISPEYHILSGVEWVHCLLLFPLVLGEM